MNELFKQFFAAANVDDATVAKFAGEFMTVAFLALLGASKDRLSESELSGIRDAWSAKRYDEVMKTLQSKYQPKEWGSFVQSVVEPIAKSYLETVVLPTQQQA